MVFLALFAAGFLAAGFLPAGFFTATILTALVMDFGDAPIIQVDYTISTCINFLLIYFNVKVSAI